MSKMNEKKGGPSTQRSLRQSQEQSPMSEDYRPPNKGLMASNKRVKGSTMR